MSTSELSQRHVSRRTVAKGAVWALPVISVGAAAPAFAQSAPSQFSSWGTTSASRRCGTSSCGSSTPNQYTWNIDNTSGSNLSYHGVLFPDAHVGQTYSNVINVYYLPFNSGTLSNQAGTTGTPHWTPLAYDPAYPTRTGPNGAVYYPWVTTWVDGSGNPASKTLVAGDIDSKGVYHLQPDYRFTVTSDCTSFKGQLYVSHAYVADLNGSVLPCTQSVNNNYCGFGGTYPSTTGCPGGLPVDSGCAGWRNNGWVGSLTSSCSVPNGVAPQGLIQKNSAPNGSAQENSIPEPAPLKFGIV